MGWLIGLEKERGVCKGRSVGGTAKNAGKDSQLFGQSRAVLFPNKGLELPLAAPKQLHP